MALEGGRLLSGRARGVLIVTKPKAPKKRPKAGQSRLAVEERVKLFIEAYLSNGENLREAAIAAGYKPSAADKAGHRMSKSVLFLSELDKRKKAILAPLMITTERILTETARLAFSDVSKIIDPITGKVLLPNELDEATRAAVASFEIDEYGRIKYKFWDKNSASERLFKHIGLYEKDNAQKANPIAEVLAMVSGSGFKPVK